MLWRWNKRLPIAACLLSELVVVDLRFDVSQGLFVQEVRRVQYRKEKWNNRWEEKSSNVLFILCVWRPKRKFFSCFCPWCCFIIISEAWNIISVYCLNGSLYYVEFLKMWDIRIAQSVWVHVSCVCDRILNQGPISNRLLGPFSSLFFLLYQDGHILVCVLIIVEH